MTFTVLVAIVGLTWVGVLVVWLRPRLMAPLARKPMVGKAIFASTFVLYNLAFLGAWEGPKATLSEVTRLWLLTGGSWGSRIWLLGIYVFVVVLFLPKAWQERISKPMLLKRKK